MNPHQRAADVQFKTELAILRLQRLDQAFLLADTRFYEKSYVSVFFICFTDP